MNTYELDQLIKLKNEANLNMVIGHNSLLVTSKKPEALKGHAYTINGSSNRIVKQITMDKEGVAFTSLFDNNYTLLKHIKIYNNQLNNNINGRYIMDNIKGFNSYNSSSNEFNSLNFLLDNFSSKLYTAFLVKIIGVHFDLKMVDVLPVVQGTDGQNNPLPQAPLYRLPYMQLQGGSNAIVITPEIGDYGLCIVSKRDISNFKKNLKEQKTIKNYLEINNNGLHLKTEGDLIIEIEGDTEIIGSGNITLKVGKDGRQSNISFY